MVHPTTLTALVAEAQAAGRRETAGRNRFARIGRRSKTPVAVEPRPSDATPTLFSQRTAGRASARYGTVAVRVARPDDQAAIRRIALLDDKPVPPGRLLVAEADGELIAALGNSGYAIAHPFRWTRDVVTLLEMRSVQLRTSHA